MGSRPQPFPPGEEVAQTLEGPSAGKWAPEKGRAKTAVS